MHHEYSWCIMSTHDALWVLMMHHEYSWRTMSTHDALWVRMMHHEYSWCIMSTHDESWVLMMHYEYSWCIMSIHDVSDLLPNGTPWELRGCWLDIFWLFLGACFWEFQDFPGFQFQFYDFVSFLISFWEDPGWPREHPGTTEDLQGPSWMQFVLKWLSKKSKKSGNIDFWKFPVTEFDKILDNRCGIDARSFSNHPFISKTMKNMKKLQIYSPSGSYVRVSIILTESGSCYSALRIQRITHDSVLTTLLTIHTDTTHDVFSTHSLLASIARISQLAVLPALTTHCSLLTSPCSLLSAHFSSLPLIAHSYR